MTLPSTLISYIIGLPLGVLLVITRRGGIRPMPTFNAVAGAIVNFLRSIPFIILLAMLFPVTRVVMGRAIGTVSVIFPLTVSAFPYVARMVERAASNEVDNGIIEAAQSMGSSTFQIVRKVLIPEAMPSLINGFAICNDHHPRLHCHGQRCGRRRSWRSGPSPAASISGSTTSCTRPAIVLVILVQIIHHARFLLHPASSTTASADGPGLRPDPIPDPYFQKGGVPMKRNCLPPCWCLRSPSPAAPWPRRCPSSPRPARTRKSSASSRKTLPPPAMSWS